MMVMQHKCIEPLGESKSDYQIFLDILSRMGLGAVFSEGCSEFDWCKRVFDSSDLPKRISWKKFLEKGYYVVPPPPEALRDRTYFSWYAEGRKKDAPEPSPLPSQYAEEFGMGLQTPSGKIEFVPETLKRNSRSEERPALNRYIPSWEGLQTKELAARFPLQLVSSHSRYSFHTHHDGKDGFLNALAEHRVRIDGYPYWVINLNPEDARQRGVKQHDLVRLYNDRGSVICVADLIPAVRPGVVKGYESSAEVDFIQTAKGLVDRGGCLNLLTSDRRMMKGTEAMATSCLIEVERWDAADFAAAA
jgi:trimethylamine-N-oxide reductase (cytochrome c)